MQIKTTGEILQLVSSFPNKDLLLYFVYQILKRNTNKHIYLSSKALKKTFGNRVYKQLCNQLVELGIIEVRKNNRYNDWSYNTYKILLRSSKKTWIDYEIIDIDLIKAVESIYENNYHKLKPHIKQVLTNLEKLTITPELLKELKKDGVQLEDEINLTANNEFKPRINQSLSGRVHHTLTNLNKRYRKKLSSRLGNLVEIDAKNAQLVFLSQYYQRDMAFNADVFGGVFYEKLSQKMGVDISLQVDKDAFKRKFFNTILCNENKAVVANSKYANAFKSLYPKMFDFLVSFNTDSTKARTLQELEAEFFITNILMDLVEMKIFVIPIHDAMIVLEKDVDIVKSMIDTHALTFFKRPIITSVSNYTFCSTPYISAPHIKEGKGKEATEGSNNDTCIYGASGKGVEQNRNKVKSQETIEKITVAIETLIEEGAKITTRSIKAKAGVSTASVNKHYKTNPAYLKYRKNEGVVECTKEKIYELKRPNEFEARTCTLPENQIMDEFMRLSNAYGFPKDVSELYINHINTNGFDSIEEMMNEVNCNPILKNLMNIKQAA